MARFCVPGLRLGERCGLSAVAWRASGLYCWSHEEHEQMMLLKRFIQSQLKGEELEIMEPFKRV